MPSRYIDGRSVAFLLATQHYRKPINFTEKAVHAATNLKYLKSTMAALSLARQTPLKAASLSEQFTAAMDEDFNAANGITVVFEP